MNDIKIAPVVIWPPVPPWLLTVPKVDLSILDHIKKDEGSPVEMARKSVNRSKVELSVKVLSKKEQ